MIYSHVQQQWYYCICTEPAVLGLCITMLMYCAVLFCHYACAVLCFCITLYHAYVLRLQYWAYVSLCSCTVPAVLCCFVTMLV
jgi:hypothetical protein